jgi:hypothetical protein
MGLPVTQAEALTAWVKHKVNEKRMIQRGDKVVMRRGGRRVQEESYDIQNHLLWKTLGMSKQSIPFHDFQYPYPGQAESEKSAQTKKKEYPSTR